MELELQEGAGHLAATLLGRVTLGESLATFKRIFDVAAERFLEKILVDARQVEGALSDLERYQLGRKLAEYCLSRSPALKVATVGTPPTITGFAARVAFNRGLTAEIFSDPAEALEWLNRVAQR
jgi:hypothetical protein